VNCTRCSRDGAEPRREHAERVLCDGCAAKPPIVDWQNPPAAPVEMHAEIPSTEGISNGAIGREAMGEAFRRWDARHDRANADRSIDGATFALDAPETVPAVWGARDEVLWPQGEPAMIYAPQGTGKSTLAQQLVLARIGIGPSEVLGLPVAEDTRPVLLIAGDRPSQIRRSLRRMVSERDRERLAERLVAWPGPLPFTLIDDPAYLTEFAERYGAGTVLIDSVKDIAIGLTEDEVGAAVNQALQHLVASGLEVLTLHHPRKANAANPKPKTIDDVYGSTWLTAGHGSVILLWGKPGDLIVELSHIKQPAGEVGPFKIVHDHHQGRSTRHRDVPLADLLADAQQGLTVREVAVLIFGTNSPEDNQIEKARRKLRALVDQGFAEPHDSPDPNGAVVYRATTVGRVTPAWAPAWGPNGTPRDPHECAHADPTHPTQPSAFAPSPLKRGEADGVAHATDDLERAERLLTDHADIEAA
jgi:hypothetical protein